MADLLKKLGNRINRLSDIINGNTSERQPNVLPDTEGIPHEKPTKASMTTDMSLFDNAIDKRDVAIKALLDEFRQATGSNSSALASLYVYIIVDCEDYDVKKYAWADDTMKKHLRLSLDNALLEGIGRNKLEINLVQASQIPDNSHEVIANVLYYSFLTPKARHKHVTGLLTIMDGTGSTEQNRYRLDSETKQIYHIGRGAVSTKSGSFRRNDIIIRDNDPDKELQARNNHVSSAHADIVVYDGAFHLKACPGGCRPIGGSCTKIISDSDSRELRDTEMKHPLHDGNLIELGRQVILQFNTIDS